MKNIFSISGSLRLLSIFVLIGMLGMFVPQDVNAIGGSPSSVRADSVLAGIPMSQSITITRAPTDPQGNLTVFVEAIGEYAQHISYEPSFVLQEGVDTYYYAFDILATDAVLGDYEAAIMFFITPDSVDFGENDGGATTGVSVRRGVEIPIFFTVDNVEVIEYELNQLYPMQTEVGEEVSVGYSVKNTGNVTWKPDKVVFSFVDVSDPTNLYTYEMSGDEVPASKPGNKGQPIELSFDPNLPAGNYLVSAVLYEDSEVVGEMTSGEFSIHPSGTLAQLGEVDYFKTNKTSYLVGETIQVESFFRNTGEISVSGVMAVDVYKESSLVDYLRSTPLTLATGEEGIFSELFALDEAGLYTLSSYVTYGNKRTLPLDLEIEVLAANALTTTQMTIILVIVCIVLLLLAIIYKKMKKEKQQLPPYQTNYPPQPPAPPIQ
jgi:hypothetical protein